MTDQKGVRLKIIFSKKLEEMWKTLCTLLSNSNHKKPISPNVQSKAVADMLSGLEEMVKMSVLD